MKIETETTVKRSTLVSFEVHLIDLVKTFVQNTPDLENLDLSRALISVRDDMGRGMWGDMINVRICIEETVDGPVHARFWAHVPAEAPDE